MNRIAETELQILHKMSVDQARKEMTAAGLVWKETKDFLSQQHFIVYENLR
jgi:hypothetical protein